MSEPFIAEIIMFGGNFAPKGWALCNGQLLSIAQNSALFSILGTTYGGDGQVTFALPDLRGRVPVHPGAGPGLPDYQLGEASGTPTVTLLSTNLPAHNHAFTYSVADPDGGSNYFAVGNPPRLGNTNPTASSTFLGPTGSNQPVSIMQPYLCVNFIIALQGIYPSRG
jgi:microcystin-dependent protein